MPFNDTHKSAYSGEPVYLYTFTIGSTKIRSTAAEQAITVGAATWGVHPGINHTDPSDTGEQAGNEVTVNIGYDHPVADYLIKYIPTQEITVEIQLLERADPGEELINYWVGTYTRSSRSFPNFEMVFEPADYETGKSAMAPDWGPDCQHTQYDNGCQLSPGTFSVAGSILSFSGLTVNTDANLTAVSADHFQGGYIEISGDYGLERAWIITQSGNNVTVDRLLPGMVSGIPITCVPSCRGDFTRCNTVFANRQRFIGAPHAIHVNPYRGDGINAQVKN